MSLSARQRKKSTSKAQKLIPDARVHGYAIGRSGAHPLLVVGVILAAFLALGIVVAMATGGVVLPGVLVILGLQHLISPPRGLAVCDRGVALTNRSFLDGKPGKVLALTTAAELRPVRQQAGRTQIAVGPEMIWVNSKEDAELRRALAQSAVAAAPAYAPPY